MGLRTLPLTIAGALLLVAACAPSQEVTYTVTPPASEAGRQCVADTCAAAVEICRQDCAGWSNFCRQDARQNELSDLSSRNRIEALTRNPERLSRPEVSVAQCDARERSCKEECQAKYRSCFAGCGGQITETSR